MPPPGQPKLTSFFKPVMVDLTDENSPKVYEMPSPPASTSQTGGDVNRSIVSDESTPSDLGKTVSKASSSSRQSTDGVVKKGSNGSGGGGSSSLHTKVPLEGEDSSGEMKPASRTKINSSGRNSSSSSSSSNGTRKKLFFLDPLDLRALEQSYLKREDRVQIIVEPESFGAAPRNFRDYVRYTDAISSAGLHCPDDVCFVCKLGPTEGPLLSCNHRVEGGQEEKPCTKVYHRSCVQSMYDWKRGDFCSLGKLSHAGRDNTSLKRQRSVIGTSAWECPRHFCFGCMDSDNARYTCSYCPVTLCAHCASNSRKIDAVFGEHVSSEYPDVEEAKDTYAYRYVPMKVANTAQTWGMSKLNPRAELIVCPHCVTRFDQCLASKLVVEGDRMNAVDGSFAGFAPSTDSHPVFGKNDKVLVGGARPPPPGASPTTRAPTRAPQSAAAALPGAGSPSLSPQGRGAKTKAAKSKVSPSLSPVDTPGRSSSSSSSSGGRRDSGGSLARSSSSQEEMPPPTVTARTPARESRLSTKALGVDCDLQEMTTASESEMVAPARVAVAADNGVKTRRGRQARTTRKSDFSYSATDSGATGGSGSEVEMEVDRRSSGEESWSDLSDASARGRWRRRSSRLSRGSGVGDESQADRARAGAGKRTRSTRSSTGSMGSTDSSVGAPPAPRGRSRPSKGAGDKRDSRGSSTDDLESKHDDDDDDGDSSALVSVQGASLQLKRKGRPPAKKQRIASGPASASATSAVGIASSRRKRDIQLSSAEKWLSNIEEAQRAQHPSKCGDTAGGDGAGGASTLEDADSSDGKARGSRGASSGAGTGTKKAKPATGAPAATVKGKGSSKGKGKSLRGCEWAELEEEAGLPHLRDVIMRNLPGRLFSNRIEDEEENGSEEEEEEEEEDHGEGGDDGDDEGEASGKRKRTSAKRKVIVEIGRDTTYSGLLDSVFGFTNEAHPHELRREGMKKLSQAARRRMEKSQPAPEDVPMLAVASVRAGLREDDDARLMDLREVWAHRKSSNAAKGKGKGMGAGTAVRDGIPSLDFPQLHHLLDSSDPLVLQEQQALLSAQALLLPFPRGAQSSASGVQVQLCGRHTQQSLTKRFNLTSNLLLSSLLGDRLGWSSAIAVDYALLASRWRTGEGEGEVEAAAGCRLPSPSDVDTLLFEATRLRDSSLQHAHCSRLRAIEKAALRPLPEAVLAPTEPAAPRPTVTRDAFWLWRPSFAKFMSLLEAVGSMLDAQTAEEQWDGAKMRWKECHLEHQQGPARRTGEEEARYCSAESATQALSGAVETLRFHAVFMARARVQWAAGQGSKDSAKAKPERPSGDDDDDDDDDDLLMMMADESGGSKSGSTSTSTSIVLGPLLPALLQDAGITAEEAFFTLLVEACRVYRWYIVVVGKPVSARERVGRGHFATLARTALSCAGHVLRHLYHLAHPADGDVEESQGKALQAVMTRSESANINNSHLMGVAMFISAGLEQSLCADAPSASTPVAAVFLRRLAAMQLSAHEYSGGGGSGNPVLAKKRDREERKEEAEDVRQALNAELLARMSLRLVE